MEAKNELVNVGLDPVTDLVHVGITLAHIDPGRAGDAVLLYIMLRKNHGDTFSITPKTMARDQVIPGWSRERYQQASKLLIEAGLIVLATPPSRLPRPVVRRRNTASRTRPR